MSDVKALYAVFLSKLFWNARKDSVKMFLSREPVVPLPANDSDASDSDSDDESVEDRDRATTEQAQDDNIPIEEEAQEIAGDFWEKRDFTPTEIPMEKFTHHFTSKSRSGVVRTGLLIAPAMANSPIKAWRLIFTARILERIVKHTNKYGDRYAQD